MTKRKVLLTILLISLVITFGFVAGCVDSVKILKISVGGDYKTDYVVGDELDINGMELLAIYEDGTTETYTFKDIRSDLVIMAFDTQAAGVTRTVTVKYKNRTAEFQIKVYTADDYEQRYTVAFDSMGGTAVEDGTAIANGAVAAPASPTKESYAFDGWFKEKAYTNQWNFNTDRVTSDMTLYAKWSFLYTITFTAPLAGSDNIIKYVKEGGELTDIPSVPTIAGKDGVWDRLSYTDIHQNLVVTAVYTDILYTVGFYDYDSDDNELELELFENLGYGTNVAEAYADRIAQLETGLYNHPNKENYHFVGWLSEFDFIESDLKVYANYERDTHTVAFVNYENDAVTETYSEATVYHDAIVSKPETPIREGYDFDGWYRDTAYQHEWEFNSDRITGDRYLYAKWTRLWALSFMDGNGELYQTVYVRNGENATPPEVPEVTGYSGVWDRELFTAISADDTINPVYTIRTYRVRFVNYDQTVLTVNGEDYQTVTYNEAATLPEETPARDGYTFKSWSVDYEHISSDTDIVAQYEVNYYIVTYVSNDPANQQSPVSVAYGSKVALPAMVRANYDFDGWFLDGAFAVQWLDEDVVTTHVTLYAKWTEKYTLKFFYTVAEVESSYEYTVRRGEYLTNVPAVPADEGKIGVWQLGGLSIDFSTYPIYENKIFQAYYTIATFYVTFHFDDGNPDQIFLVEYGGISGVPADPEHPDKTGYTFVSWDKDPTATVIKGTTVFYPVYNINTFTVTFAVKAEDSDSGTETVVKTTNVDYGSAALAPDVHPAKEGYSFTGWDKAFSSITENIVIYAQFMIRSFTVSFRDDGNNTYYDAINVPYNTSVEFVGELPSLIGWNFAGWDYNSDGKFDAEEDAPEANPILANRVILAKFAQTIYTVTFDAMGGNMLDPYRGTYGSKATEPTPTNTDDTLAFFGWYIESSYNNKYDFSTPVTSSFTLYAKWEIRVDGSEGIVYELDTYTDTYRVKSIPSNATSVKVANNYGGADGVSKSVTSIGAGAMKNCVNLMSVMLPSTITAIGANAFFGCTKLTTIAEDGKVESGTNYKLMPDSITSISASAFSGCTALVSVYFDVNYSLLTSIGTNAFSGCTKLTGFRFPSYTNPTTGARTYITIGERAFSGCSAVKEYTFPTSITYIGNEAFVGNTKLRFVTFDHTQPPTLESTAFKGATNSFRIYVNSTTEIPTQYTTDTSSGWQTYRSKLLSSSYITNNGDWAYTVITSGAQQNKLRLLQYIGYEEEITIDESLLVPFKVNGSYIVTVGDVEDYAFDYTPTYIALDSSITISDYTFTEAKSLAHLYVKISESNIISKEVIYEMYTDLPKLNTLSVSAAMTLSAFFGGYGVPTSLTTVRIINDSSYRILPESMFEDCSSLITVTLPQQLQTISNYAFKGCTSLTTVTMTAVRTIGKEAFSGCTALGVSNGTVGLMLPSTVQSIGEDAFLNTLFLSEMKAADDFVILGGGILYSYNGSDAVVRLPSATRIINIKAFKGNTSVRTVVFTSDSYSVGAVSTIGDYAFTGCVALENVIMPSTLSAIGVGAFYGDAKFVKLIIVTDSSLGDIVPTVGSTAFYGTMSGISLYLPSTTVAEAYAEDPSWTSVFADRIYGKSMVLLEDWVIGYESVSAVSVIQYFGTEKDVIVADRIAVSASSTLNTYKIYPYAFPRDTTSVSLSAQLNLDTAAFGGLTGLTKLTITDTGNIRTTNRAIFKSLLTTNAKLTTLCVGGAQTIAGIFGAVPAATSQLTTVKLLDGTSSIVAEMFRDCLSIVNIEFPEQDLAMSGVGAYAFENSGWINACSDEFVYVPTALGKLIVAYKGSSNIVTIPTDSDVRGLVHSLFKNNTNIEVVYVGENITNIFADAFAGTSALVKMFMYGTTAPVVTSTTFSGLATGAELFVPNLSAYSSTNYNAFTKVANVTQKEGNIIYQAINSTTAKLIQCLDESKTVALPQTVNGLTVTQVGNNIFLQTAENITVYGDVTLSTNVFSNLFNIKSVTVLNTSGFVAANGASFYKLFTANSALSSLSFKGDITVKTLLGGNNATSNLRTVTILSGATSLVDNLFAGATGVATINFPNTITSVGYNVFEGTAWYGSQSDFVILFNSLLYKYKGNKKIPNVPAEVQTVNSYAFATYQGVNGSGNPVWTGNQLMTSLRFALYSQCTYISANAFYGCTNLATVDLPDAIEYVSPNAFTGTKITADSNGLLIVSGASTGGTIVYYSGSASTVTVPYAVKGISQGAFAGRTAITTVSFETGSNLEYVRSGAFSGCTSLTYFGINGVNAGLPTKLAEIGANAFLGTPWFTNAADFVTNNGRLLLYTGNAASVSVSASITGLASGAFASVSSVQSVAFASETPILASNMGEGALDSVTYIYVPSESVDAYKGAWPAYKDKIIGM